MSTGSTFEDNFTVEIFQVYNKPMTRQTEEGTFMINIKGWRDDSLPPPGCLEGRDQGQEDQLGSMAVW